MPGCNLDRGEHILTRRRDDDAYRIDLVVRGVGAVKHSVDGVEMNLTRNPASQFVLEDPGRKWQYTVRFRWTAAGMAVTDAGLTKNSGCHLGRVLSRPRR